MTISNGVTDEAGVAVEAAAKPKRPSRAAAKPAEVKVDAAAQSDAAPVELAKPVVEKPVVETPEIATPVVAKRVAAKPVTKPVAAASDRDTPDIAKAKPVAAKAPAEPIAESVAFEESTPEELVYEAPAPEPALAELDGAPDALPPEALGLSDAVSDADPEVDLDAVEDDSDALDVPPLALDDEDDDTPEPPRAAGTPPPPRSARTVQQGPIMNRPIQISRASNKDETFAEGDHVVYPTHGVGRVEKIATEEIAGHKLELIHITFEENRMTLRVPVAKARSAGLRKLATRKLFDEALAVLRGRARIKRTMWSRRAQEYDAKINSGDPLQIAEVVRDLHRNAGQPDQSFSERQIYEAAMDRLSAELGALDGIDKLAASNKLTAFLKTIA